jgi:hypothetical protein
VDVLQPADVDEEQVLHVAQRRLVVGGRLRRDAEPEALGERDGVGDVAGVGGERDRSGPLVDEQVERRARLVVRTRSDSPAPAGLPSAVIKRGPQ